MSEHENDLGDVRYYAFYVGTVIDRKDPEALGRVRLRVPGLLEPASGWALPIGTVGGGSAQRGMKFVPQVGAEVGVFFKGGDPDAPYYIAGHWGHPDGGTEMLTDARLPPGESEDVGCIEFKRFAITFDERAGHESLVLRDKKTGDSIEFDGVKFGIIIKATVALMIKVTGLVNIEAPLVMINGRTVAPGARPI